MRLQIRPHCSSTIALDYAFSKILRNWIQQPRIYDVICALPRLNECRSNIFNRPWDKSINKTKLLLQIECQMHSPTPSRVIGFNQWLWNPNQTWMIRGRKCVGIHRNQIKSHEESTAQRIIGEKKKNQRRRSRIKIVEGSRSKKKITETDQEDEKTLH